MICQSASESGRRLEDVVGEGELADVVQQSGSVNELLVALSRPSSRAISRRNAPPRRMARRHPVAQVESVHQRAHHSDLEAGELARSLVERLGALLRAQQLPQEVLKGEQHTGEERQRGEAHRFVERRRSRQRAGR